MLELSDIQSSQEELQDYYAQLRAQHVTPAWIGGGISIEPRSEAVPYLWRWRDLRPKAMRAAELVGTQQAERRVLRLTNPKLPGTASSTLVANIQIVMPGEIARAHRHSAAALRLIIEGRGGYTVVNGERVPMYPGDLVLTPNWSWHDHANDTDAPMIWLDGLDTPLVRMLEAGFYEEYHQERQYFGAAVNASQWHYPMSEMRVALQRLAAADTGNAGEGIILEYTNRVTGGPVMPTIACHMQLLRPGEKTRARRRICRTNYHVVEGAGYSVVGDERFDWELTVDREERAALKGQAPAVLWLTGLSGAGKSTIADLVEKQLLAAGRHTMLLDGDNVRHGLNRDLCFTDVDRVENIRRVGEVAKLMAEAGLIVICSFISPFRAERRMVRELIAPTAFLEIFVDTPLEECIRRDLKGLYAKAKVGRVANFTGLDSSYEDPEAPELRLTTLGTSPDDAAEQIIDTLIWRQIIGRNSPTRIGFDRSNTPLWGAGTR